MIFFFFNLFVHSGGREGDPVQVGGAEGGVERISSRHHAEPGALCGV